MWVSNKILCSQEDYNKYNFYLIIAPVLLRVNPTARWNSLLLQQIYYDCDITKPKTDNTSMFLYSYIHLKKQNSYIGYQWNPANNSSFYQRRDAWEAAGINAEFHSVALKRKYYYYYNSFSKLWTRTYLVTKNPKAIIWVCSFHVTFCNKSSTVIKID